jgi:hypothetical protein
MYQKMSYKPGKFHKKCLAVYMLVSHNMWQIFIDGGSGWGNIIGFCQAAVLIDFGYHIILMIANV